MIRILFAVSDRFGVPLEGAILESRVKHGSETYGISHGSAGKSGKGTMLIDGPAEPGEYWMEYFVHWTDPEGVLWGCNSRTKLKAERVVEGGPLDVLVEQGFSITTRMFPQALPLPEIGHTTRQNLLRSKEGAHVHRAYEEARDSMLAGLPDASAAMSGKAIECAIGLRGVSRQWPLDKWAAERYALGDYLRDPVIEDDLRTCFNEGFYDLLLGTNIPRILAAHQKGTRLHMDEARAVLRSLTQLIDGWFGEAAKGR